MSETKSPTISIPENFSLVRPGAKYQSRAILALFMMLSFIVLYLGLTAWFCWTSYRLINDVIVNDTDNFGGIIVGCASALLALFLIKALFFFKKGAGDHPYLEISKDDEPELFEFLYQLADEAKAPRPHRVFVSDDVNAAVFYDLSIINLIFPSKKNLVIGLGLVNALNRSEMKAVLAHEFGHFGQKSMAVGRWVYVAQQVAGQLIADRGVLDSIVKFISSIDLRVAWIGWILQLIVWSIRSLVELFFRLVILAQRSLSREMEYQADLVAVSLTGSEALVHALHKLQAADQSWSETLTFANTEIQEKRKIEDLYKVQTEVIEKFRNILNEPEFGETPKIPSENPNTHRVFSSEVAVMPQMWSTHPENYSREENAKRVYIPSEIDHNQAWSLFKDPKNLRTKVSGNIYKGIDDKEQKFDSKLTEESFDSHYDLFRLNRKYKGTYLHRDLMESVEDIDAWCQIKEDEPFSTNLNELYPDSLSSDLKQLDVLRGEKNSLEAIKDKILEAPGGIIRHRGKKITRKELPSILEQVEEEIQEKETFLQNQEHLCHQSFLKMARKISGGWEKTMMSYFKTIHYASHRSSDLADASYHMNNVFQVVIADGNVSSKELVRLIKSCNEVYDVLFAVHTDKDHLTLNKSLHERFENKTWKEELEVFDFPRPNEENIQQWMQAIEGWIHVTQNSLTSLRNHALEDLLKIEDDVLSNYLQNKEETLAPSPVEIKDLKCVFTHKNKRAIQKKLGWWDRFQTADGAVASTLRVIIALSIVGAALFLGETV